MGTMDTAGIKCRNLGLDFLEGLIMLVEHGWD